MPNENIDIGQELLNVPMGDMIREMDELDAEAHLEAFRKKAKEPIYPISCVSDQGFKELKSALLEAVLEVRKAEADAKD